MRSKHSSQEAPPAPSSKSPTSGARTNCKATFKCTLCPSTFVRKDSLLSHLRQHRTNRSCEPAAQAMLLLSDSQEDGANVTSSQPQPSVAQSAHAQPSPSLYTQVQPLSSVHPLSYTGQENEIHVYQKTAATTLTSMSESTLSALRDAEELLQDQQCTDVVASQGAAESSSLVGINTSAVVIGEAPQPIVYQLPTGHDVSLPTDAQSDMAPAIVQVLGPQVPLEPLQLQLLSDKQLLFLTPTSGSCCILQDSLAQSLPHKVPSEASQNIVM